MKKYIWYFGGMVISSLGNTLMVKMMLGQSTFNAMTYNLSLLTGLRIGYISIIGNTCLMIIQIIILNKSFKKLQLLQMIPGIICGVVLNFFMYDFFLTANLVVDNYFIELIIFAAGLIINAFGISLVTSARIVAAPCESLCLVLSKKTSKSFKFYRIGSDIVFVAIAVIAMFLLGKNTNTIREGTIINLVCMGILIGYFNDFCENYLYK
ncbi:MULTISPECIES: YczE/YyaS/YitT family protein [Clostridium]|uniref:YczE/YyaS/YitT family protein n=1 Tax=Clostridium TaxID=1485 RepID=UPI000824DE32|nr:MULTISPECIES: hypothetical protein [Clostridium]PJI07431.1 hypothetical protein CUB90_05955 [Clostridium sp. CT7]